MNKYTEIEVLTTEEIEKHPILYKSHLREKAKYLRKKIKEAVQLVHLAVKNKSGVPVTLYIISRIWVQCINEIKMKMQKKKDYQDGMLTDDSEDDLTIIEELVASDDKKLRAQLKKMAKKTEVPKKSKSGKRVQSKKSSVKKVTPKKHRVGKTSMIPKTKKVTRHPKLDSFAQKRQKEQSALIEEFCVMKEEFIKSNKKLLDIKNVSDYWPIICEKFLSIHPDHYDDCFDEILATLEE